MMIVYEPNGDCPGRITGISSGPDPEVYGKVLDKHRMTWIYAQGATTDMIMSHYVDIDTKRLVGRQRMQLHDDGVKVTGIPAGTRVSIVIGGVSIESEIVNDGEVEFTPDHPGTYTFICNCWPYLPLQMEVRR